MESYKHQFAKTTLVNWLREVCVDNDHTALPPAGWRVNRGPPNYGIWVEYPVCLDSTCKNLRGIDLVWDEDSWWAGLDGLLINPRAGERPPTYEEAIAEKLLPIVIFDVAIQHKGSILYAFEIEHTHGISNLKAEYLNRIRHSQCLEVYAIDADWILSRVKRPDQLVCRRVA